MSADPAAARSRTGCALALAALPGITRERLRALLERWPDPVDAVAAVRAGRAGEAIPEPRSTAVTAGWGAAVDTDRPTRRAARRGTRALLRHDPAFPLDPLTPDCPGVLFTEGSGADALDRPRVAIVGTRRATPHGLADAHDLAADLAAAGVTVVSGMAIGIDGAAHRGALDGGGPTIGVIATGLDVAYPRRHGALHAEVRATGLLVGEQAFGTPPAPWRFPVRNHVIAALADVVVVVEATITGGAMITARAANDLGVHLMAVPGSRRNPAAAGCNELLRAGWAAAALDADDVLAALGMTPGARRRSATPPVGVGGHVLAACGGEPATPDQLAARCGLDPPAAAAAVEDLVRGGWLRRERGWLWPV